MYIIASSMIITYSNKFLILESRIDTYLRGAMVSFIAIEQSASEYFKTQLLAN